MIVTVQVFAWHIVFRNLVCDHLCHIWIFRIFDTLALTLAIFRSSRLRNGATDVPPGVVP